MPQFSFTARDRDGRPQSGALSADSASQLIAELRSRGWIVLDVRDQPAGPTALARLANTSAGSLLPASRLDVELGLQQLATMLRSGLTLLSALRTVAEQARRRSMARVWDRIATRIEEGASLGDGLADYPRLFPNMVVQLVRVGEQSGTLDLVARRAAEHLEQTRRVRTALLTSLMYPAFVLAAAIGVTAFMLLALVPKLEKFLIGRGRRLPPISQMLLDLSSWLNAHGTVLLVALLGAIVATMVLLRWPASRARIDRALLRLPLVGGLLRLAGTATIARGLSILLESGITLLTALQTVGGLVTNRAMKARVTAARDEVIEGNTLASPFSGGAEFTPMLGRMMAVGETTGTLGPVMAEVADFHEAQLAAAIRRFSVLIEPVTIAVVGGIVGFVYVAFFLAMFAVASGGR